MTQFIEPFSHCPLSGIPVTGFQQNDDVVYYFITIGSTPIPLRLAKEAVLKIGRIKSILPIIRTIIRTGNWPFDAGRDITIQMLSDMAASPTVPKGPEDKLRKLFMFLYDQQDYVGQSVSTTEWIGNKTYHNRLYMETAEEWTTYFNALFDQNLLRVTFNQPRQGSEVGTPLNYRLTYQGLQHYIDITDEGRSSNNCFIAMSFGTSEGLGETRSAIKEVLVNLHYQPQLVDEVHLASDQTINDGIIALIKKSKFAICDFTEQKQGVYFEAGYACGRGMPVIYTCHETWKDKLHFDTNHFPHIFYKTTDELKQKLKDKIEAWIE